MYVLDRNLTLHFNFSYPKLIDYHIFIHGERTRINIKTTDLTYFNSLVSDH
jgi:hypothetical protein